jgi:SAM-dependent methyltransferase
MDRRTVLAASAATLLSLTARSGFAQTTPASRVPDVVYVPTPEAVVDEMLRVANVGPKDVLYDLGSGDGRIPITAARRFGTRGLGIDIDPQRVREARDNAERAKVADKVRFVEGDLFELDLSEATVITLYLLPALNLRLRPRLLALKPGTRIVSHDFSMGDWEPEKVIEVGHKTVYFWRVPQGGLPKAKP